MPFLDSETPNLLNKRQSTGQTLNQINNLPVSTGTVLRAGFEEATTGTATTGQITNYFAIEKADLKGKKLSEEEFKNSPLFRQGIKYYDGMTDKGLEIINDRQQRQEYRDTIASKAPATFLASTLASSFVDPVNLGVSVATAGAGTVLSKIPSVAKMGYRLSKAQKLVGGALAESAVGTAVTGYGANQLGKTTSDDYTIENGIVDFTVGAGLSIGLPLAGGAVKNVVNNYRLNKVEQSITKQAVDNGIDPEYLLSNIGVESSFNPKKVNPDTEAFGYYQFLPSTAKEYGIDKNSTVQEQTQAFIQFTNDNKSYLEKQLGRDVDNLDLYMAHWLGRGGASKVLQYSNDTRFLDIPDIGKTYDNPKAVLTQNGLPENATIGEMKRSRANRMSGALRNIDKRKNFNSEMDILVKTDHAMAKSLNDDVVTFNEINAKELQKISDEADNYLKQFNDDFDKTLSDIETKVLQDNVDLELMRSETMQNLDGYQSTFNAKLTEFNMKNQEIFKDIFDGKIDPVDFYQEINHKAYSDTFNQLATLKQKHTDIASKIESFNLENRKLELAKQSQVPIDTLNAIDNEISTLKEQRQLERERLKGKRLKLFDAETETILTDLKNKKTDITLSQFATNADNQSIDYIQALKQANRTARQELQSLKAELQNAKTEIQATSQALGQMNQDFKQKINKFVNESFLQNLEAKKTYIDYEGANSIDATTEYLDSITDSDTMKSLESDIERLKNENVLDDDMLDLVNKIYENDETLLNDMYSSVKGCLLGGGGN